MLQSKVALITGGSSGIGLETAKVFIENGAFVYITGRNEDRLKNAISILGNNAKYIRADISKKDDMLNVREVIKSEKGHLDIVFANAGVGKYISFEDITEEDIDWTFNNNFKGTIFTIQSVLPILNDGASIILNTSVTANLGLSRFSLYAGAKSAVRSLIFSLTTDLKDKRIRVNAVSPGVIPTNAATGELGRSKEEEKKLQEERQKLIPLNRMGNSTDIANAVLFLASDKSSFITGTEITVDGGLSRVFANKL